MSTIFFLIYKNPSHCTKKCVNADYKVKFKYFGVYNSPLFHSPIFTIICERPSCCAHKYASANHYAKFQDPLESPTFTVFPRIYEHPLHFEKISEAIKIIPRYFESSESLPQFSPDLRKKQLLLKMNSISTRESNGN